MSNIRYLLDVHRRDPFLMISHCQIELTEYDRPSERVERLIKLRKQKQIKLCVRVETAVIDADALTVVLFHHNDRRSLGRCRGPCDVDSYELSDLRLDSGSLFTVRQPMRRLTKRMRIFSFYLLKDQIGSADVVDCLSKHINDFID